MTKKLEANGFRINFCIDNWALPSRNINYIFKQIICHLLFPKPKKRPMATADIMDIPVAAITEPRARLFCWLCAPEAKLRAPDRCREEAWEELRGGEISWFIRNVKPLKSSKMYFRQLWIRDILEKCFKQTLTPAARMTARSNITCHIWRSSSTPEMLDFSEHTIYLNRNDPVLDMEFTRTDMVEDAVCSEECRDLHWQWQVKCIKFQVGVRWPCLEHATLPTDENIPENESHNYNMFAKKYVDIQGSAAKV